MLVFELHTQVNQRLQEVASFKRDKYRPEEIDMALNKAMFRLLEEAVDSKFEESQINLKHVTALIQKNKVNEPITPGTGDPLLEDNLFTSYIVLPPDFYWLINSRLEIVTDPVNCGTAPSLGTATYTENIAVVPFPALGSTPYFANTSVTSSVMGTLYTSPTEITNGFNSPNSKYVVVNHIVEHLFRKTQVRAYWERYRDVHYKNSFIFVSTSPMGTITLTSNAQVSAVAQIANNYTIYNRGGIPALASKSIEISSTKVTTDNDLYDTLVANYFYRARQNNPIADQTQDYLIFYRDESFLITRSYMDYIRKPRTISLLLNQTCELAEVTHPKVIDLAVEILRLDTKDQAYPQTVQDTQLRTN